MELVFDNSDHSLQGAWGQYAEVSIKRQLTRQGESTYFINNQTVRRRDITDLFLVRAWARAVMPLSSRG